MQIDMKKYLPLINCKHKRNYYIVKRYLNNANN